jgi:hypothetical protein
MHFGFKYDCPWCYSDQVMKSRFRASELILPSFFFRPVRCSACYRRRYIPIFHRALHWPQETAPPVVLAKRDSLPRKPA